MLFSTFHCLDPTSSDYSSSAPFIANRGTRKRVLLDHQVDFKFDFLISPRNPFIPDFHSKSLDHNFMQFFLFNFDKRADMWLQIGICLVSFPKLRKSFFSENTLFHDNSQNFGGGWQICSSKRTGEVCKTRAKECSSEGAKKKVWKICQLFSNS